MREGVLRRLDFFPLCRQCYGALIKERLNQPDAGNSPLIAAFLENDDTAKRLEEQLRRLASTVKNFSKMFDITLGNDPEPDETIADHLWEVATADYLLTRGYESVEYLRSSARKAPDFVAWHKDECFLVEVKGIRQREFKDFDAIDVRRLDLGYCRSCRTDGAMQQLFRTKLTKAIQQINAFAPAKKFVNYRTIVAIWVDSVDYAVFKNAAQSNMRAVYDQEFSGKLTKVWLFLYPAIDQALKPYEYAKL